MKSNLWILSIENQKGKSVYCIKRWVKLPDGSGKLLRLPLEKYRQWRDDPEELKKLIIRLNNAIPVEERVQQAVEIKHAFISPEFLENYKEYLSIQIPSKRHANNEYYNVVTYFLNFFINTLKLSNPLQWHLVHKTEWAKFLVSDQVPPSAKTKKSIVFAANRFMAYLHEHRPTEVVPLKFNPITKAKFKEIQANLEMRGEALETKLISDVDWKLISKNLPDYLSPFVMLAFHYGLRKSETLGVKLEDVRKAHLSVERQLSKFRGEEPQYSVLKGRESRKVPHWSATAAQAYLWIEAASKNLCHPSTLGHEWKAFMDRLNLDYHFHDLRHTFITKSIRKQIPRDVQLAAGHKNIQTTMGYLHDDRELDDAQFVPVKAV